MATETKGGCDVLGICGWIVRTFDVVDGGQNEFSGPSMSVTTDPLIVKDHEKGVLHDKQPGKRQ